MDEEHPVERGEAPRPRRSASARRRGGRRLPLGAVFGDSFRVFGRFAVPILLVVIGFTGVITLVEVSALSEFANHERPFDAWLDAPARAVTVVTDTLQYVMSYFLQGMLTFIVLQHLRGRAPGPFAAIAEGFGRTLGALPLALVISIVVGLLMAASSYVGILTSIPAAVIQCGWFVAVPVAVSERASVGGALNRSWSLTSGSKWRIFLVQLVFGFVGVVFVLVFFFTYLSARMETGTFAQLRSAIVISNVIMIPFIALLAVSGPVAYHHLRREREGAEVEDLAAVFD